jgi:hypothetical protein
MWHACKNIYPQLFYLTQAFTQYSPCVECVWIVQMQQWHDQHAKALCCMTGCALPIPWCQTLPEVKLALMCAGMCPAPSSNSGGGPSAPAGEDTPPHEVRIEMWN